MGREATTAEERAADHFLFAPLEKLPLLVRAGAIIPLIPIQQTWQNSTMSPMTLRIYPEGQSSFTIRADDLTYPHHPKPYTALEETTIQCQAKKSGVTIHIGKAPLLPIGWKCI